MIVVPCYNEERRLPLESYLAFTDGGPGDVGFLLVDDGSRDATLDRLRELARQRPDRFRVLALPRNAGKAEAVRRGVLAALEGGPQLVGFWDSDLATPLEAIPAMAALMDADPGLEMVFGARVKLLGHDIQRNPWRHYLGRVGGTLISLLLGMAIYDSQCGAKLFRVTGLMERVFGDPFLSRWLFDVELILRFQAAWRETGRPSGREPIRELPLPRWSEVAGSKVKPADYLRALADYGRLYHRYRGGS